jgi:DNA-directed RNA polymerase specialized sigma subunit
LFNYLYDDGRKRETDLVSARGEQESQNKTQYEKSLRQKRQIKSDVIENLKRITFKEPCEEEIAKKLNEKDNLYLSTLNATRDVNYSTIAKLPKGINCLK